VLLFRGWTGRERGGCYKRVAVAGFEVDCPTTISGTDEKKLASVLDRAGVAEGGGSRWLDVSSELMD